MYFADVTGRQPCDLWRDDAVLLFFRGRSKELCGKESVQMRRRDHSARKRLVDRVGIYFGSSSRRECSYRRLLWILYLGVILRSIRGLLGEYSTSVWCVVVVAVTTEERTTYTYAIKLREPGAWVSAITPPLTTTGLPGFLFAFCASRNPVLLLRLRSGRPTVWQDSLL